MIINQMFERKKETPYNKSRTESEEYVRVVIQKEIAENKVTNAEMCKARNRRVPNGMHGGVEGRNGN